VQQKALLSRSLIGVRARSGPDEPTEQTVTVGGLAMILNYIIRDEVLPDPAHFAFEVVVGTDKCFALEA